MGITLQQLFDLVLPAGPVAYTVGVGSIVFGYDLKSCIADRKTQKAKYPLFQIRLRSMHLKRVVHLRVKVKLHCKLWKTETSDSTLGMILGESFW